MKPLMWEEMKRAKGDSDVRPRQCKHHRSMKLSTTSRDKDLVNVHELIAYSQDYQSMKSSDDSIKKDVLD